MTDKCCLQCQITKPVTEFFTYRKQSTGEVVPRGTCKACTKINRRSSPLYQRREARAIRFLPEEPEGMKWCSLCREIKPLDDFWKDATGRHGKLGRCKPCARPISRENMQRQRAADPEKHRQMARDNRLARRYGVTSGWFHDQIEKTGGLCPTCGATYDPAGSRKAFHPVVDHCHDSGRIRGVICQSCNIVLGAARDNPETLRSLARWLEDPSTSLPDK